MLASLFRFAVVVGFLAVSTGHAANLQPFDMAAFDKLQAEGKPILVHVHADWCPTCRAQAPILAELLADPRFKDVAALAVDFDTQKDVRRTLKVNQQSTLIIYRGRTEVARTVGDTRKESIAATLQKAKS
ncbi:MAG: thioredoxin family protein [Casimicrobiaceae bacterium]